MVSAKKQTVKETKTEKPIPKKAVIFVLEDVLVPGRVSPDLSEKNVKVLLEKLIPYAKQHGITTYVISGFTQEKCLSLMKEHHLLSYFDEKNVRGVHSEYLSNMAPLDKERYDTRCAGDPNCKDEYFRQVEIQQIIAKEKWSPEQVLLIGHDYWFEGFYTRRFSKVDTLFFEKSLSIRGKSTTERIKGLWSFDGSFEPLKKIIEGKTPPSDYTPLDVWVNISLSEALFGGKGLPTLKRVILERKSDGSRDFVQKLD